MTTLTLNHFTLEDRAHELISQYAEEIDTMGATYLKNLFTDLAAEEALPLPEGVRGIEVVVTKPNTCLVLLHSTDYATAALATPEIDVTYISFADVLQLLDKFVPQIRAAAAWSEAPVDAPHPAQMYSLGVRLPRVMRSSVMAGQPDLPEGYLFVVEDDGFTYGIAPDGRTSS